MITAVFLRITDMTSVFFTTFTTAVFLMTTVITAVFLLINYDYRVLTESGLLTLPQYRRNFKIIVSFYF